MSKDKIILLIIILVSVLIFSPALFNFFSSDDWFHLDIARISNPKEFFNFFSISQTPQSTPFYRPLSTQIFFFIFQTIFGLNSLPYHVFIFCLFITNLYLIYKLSLIFLWDKYQSLITVSVYAFSATNFVRLYFISVVQEMMMLNFLLFAFLNYAKSSRLNMVYAFIFFIIAILSKETAFVLPIILLAYDLLKKRLNIGRIAPYFFVIIPFLIIRYNNLNEGVISSYIFDFSIRKFCNTITWYFLWSLGTPELLVDYVGSGFKILPRFYSDFPYWSKIILSFLGITILSFSILVFLKIRKFERTAIFLIAFFIIGLLPIIFLPTHKFTLQLTLSMVGFSLFVGYLSKSKSKAGIVFLISFIILNLLTNLLTYQTHYSVSRSRVSQRVFKYFIDKYPKEITSVYFEFINDTPNFGKEWGGSKQISQATSNSDLFKVLYKDHSYKVFFEDSKEERRPEGNIVIISTKMFLRY